MNKYPCGLIEDLIPLYIEGDVNNETKEIVEKHLKECKDCSALAQEYSNDELKLDIIKEDLPQANTFKKWMKKLKVWDSITAAIVIFTAIVIGVIGYKMGEKTKNDLLTVKTIVRTLEKQGVSLKEDKSESPDNFQLDGVKPSVFSVGKKQGTLLVYTFKSLVEREDKVKNSGRFNDPFSLVEYAFNAKNTFLVYIAPRTPTTEKEMKSIVKTKVLISDIVFKYLNDGKEIVYKGESSNWEGTFTLKYYEHWWKDETGTFNHESYSEQYPVIKYKASDKAAVGSIDFEYKTPVGGGKTTDGKLNEEGYLRCGSSSSNGALLHKNDEITFTIKCNGKEEDITLKAR